MNSAQRVAQCSVLMCLIIVFLVAAAPDGSASTYTAFPTPRLVKLAVEGAILELNDPAVEIVGQGSWISRQNYRDPRLKEFLLSASDHDMRIVFRSRNVTDARALEVWRNFRMGVQRQLQSFVQMGILNQEELSLVRNAINIYPPEELMRGVNNATEAVARFNGWGVYPKLADAGADAAEGSFGQLLKFERQGYEKGARGMAFFLDKGQVRTGSVDLVHMLEEQGLRTGEAVSTAARHNLDDALKALGQGNLRDARKHMLRARDYLKEAKNRLRAGVTANDQVLDDLAKKVDDLWQKFEKIETRTELFSDKVAKKTAAELAEQKALVEEFKKLQKDLQKVLTEALDDSYLLSALSQAVKDGKYMQARFFRGLLSPTGKWLRARTGIIQGMGKVKDVVQKIGFLNIVAAYFTVKDLPQIYVNEGPDKAAARLSMGIATLAIPELAVAELVSLLATSVAELAVDYVASYGYQAVTSTQDCADLIAGLYTVYGREAAVLGGGRKCHDAGSLRHLACLVPDTSNLRWYYTQGKGLPPKDIPSEIKSLVACHAENASRRTDEPRKTDKTVEETLIAKCLGTVVMGWLEEREMAIQQIQVLAREVARSEIKASFDPKKTVIPKDTKSTTLTVTASVLPSLSDLIPAIKDEMTCVAGGGAKPFVYEHYTWKVDGNTVEKRGSRSSREFVFDKEGTHTICVEYEFEYGVFGGKMTVPPAEAGGIVSKPSCFDVDVTTEAPQGKLGVKITGEKGAAAPTTAETRAQVVFEVKLENARPIEEYSFTWKVDGTGVQQEKSARPGVGIFSFSQPGTYTVKVETYDAADSWKAKGVQPRKLGEAKHAIIILPSITDAKVTVKISGPSKIILSNTIEMTAAVTADDNVRSRLRPPVWFYAHNAGPDEDPDDESLNEPVGQGNKASYKPLRAGKYRFVVKILGEGANRPVAEDSVIVEVACMDAPPGYTGWRTGDNKICELEGAKAKQPLSVQLIADRTRVRTGEKVAVTAYVAGGSRPYAWAWSGSIEGNPSDMSTVYVADAKKSTLSVKVTDSEGKTAEGKRAFAVDAPDVRIEGIPLKASYGSSHQARLLLKEEQSVLWQSSPTVNIDKQEAPITWIRFDQLGRVKIWAEIRAKKGEVFETLGRTEEVEVEVSAPAVRIVFDPPVQKSGGQVTAEIKSEPAIPADAVRYVWLSPPTTKKEQLSQEKIRFNVEDSRPVPIEAEARTARTGDTIASLLGQYDPTGKETNVGVSSGDKDGTSKKLAADKLSQAKTAVAAGDLDKGISLADEAASLDASLSEARQLTERWKKDKKTVEDHVKIMDSHLGANRFADADKALVAAKNLHPKYKPVVDAEGRLKAKRDAFHRLVQEKINAAQLAARKGEMDAAIILAGEAAVLDPSNAEAKQLADKLKKDKAQIHDQIAKAKKLMDEGRFADAQRELIVAKNLNANYPPVAEADRDLTERWRKYDSDVQQKLYEVRSANERREFKKALEIAAAWRASTKLDANADAQLKQQEEWAKRMEADKEQKRQILKKAESKLKAYDYAGAVKDFEEGFRNANILWATTDTEPPYYQELQAEAIQKNKRLGELQSVVRNAAENTDSYYNQVHVLEPGLKHADEAIGLQPTNEQWKKWRAMIEARLEKLKADNARIAQGRKYLEAAANAHRSFLSQDSYVRADTGRWDENVEAQMQNSLVTAVENYRQSLKYIPDPKVEGTIKELEGVLEGRRNFLANVRQAKQLRAEADVLAQQARAEKNFDLSQQKFAQAIGKYQKSFSLYRPPDEQTLAKIIHNLDIESKTNAFQKYWADGTALEQQNRIVEALAALEKAAAFRTYAVMEGEWVRFSSQLQNLRNRIEFAKRHRLEGEQHERAGKTAEAISSYRKSLQNVFDAGLDSHVKMLEQRLAEANRGKMTADRLWEEGRALHGQGRMTEALGKFKESLTHWQDQTRSDYVGKLEQARATAARLRDEGAALQQQGRLQDAVNKYKQSLQTWPNPDLEKHIALVEAEIRRIAELNACAQRNRDEGVALERQGRLQEALVKYKASYACWQTPEMAQHIRNIETKIAQPPQPPESPIGTDPPVTDTRPEDLQYVRGFAGKWNTNWGRLEFSVNGLQVKGNYTHDKGRIEATLSSDGKTMEGVWLEAPSYSPPRDGGKVTFTLSPDGNTIKGRWGYGDNLSGGDWTGTRIKDETPPGDSVQSAGQNIFNNGNVGGVYNKPTCNPSFTLNQSYQITYIENYHWNNGKGAPGGTISLRRQDGATYGPWRVSTKPGQGGAPNAYWMVSPNVTLGPGTYTIIDSDPSTWSHNTGSKGCGFSIVKGVPAPGGGTYAPPVDSQVKGAVTVRVRNASRENVHLVQKGDSYGPGNRLTPGQTREMSVTVPPNGLLEFCAGRNGQTIQCNKTAVDPSDKGRQYTVTFDESNPYNRVLITPGLR